MPLPEVTTGAGIVTTDTVTAVESLLTEAGIPVQDGGEVTMRDGSAGLPIELPELDGLSEVATFPYILLMNESGKILKLPATSGTLGFMLRAINGSWQQVAGVGQCFPTTDVCECDATSIAGFQVNEDGTSCLVRLTNEDFITNFVAFQDTQSIHWMGSGTEAAPFKANAVVPPFATDGATTYPNALIDTVGGLLVRPGVPFLGGVSSLPTPSVQGLIFCVPDANATTRRTVVAGGGANTVLVMGDGAGAWIIV